MLTLKDSLQEAIEHNFTDLKALILFLVFEKQIHTLEDDAEVLERYFKPNNRPKMNRLLQEYKAEKEIQYPSRIFKATSENATEYIKAITYDQAVLFARKKGLEHVEFASESMLMIKVENGQIVDEATLEELADRIDRTPSIL